MSTKDNDQENTSLSPADPESLLDQLSADAQLLPEKFQAYYEKYLKRDFGRCQTTLSFMPPSDRDHPLAVLEVGSFPGVMSIVIKQNGYNLDCIDLNPERMKALAEKHELSIKKCDIETEDLPCQDNGYDVVLFTEILEHLRINPLHALKQLKRVLKPGGVLILTVPNISPTHRLKFLFGVDYQGDIVAELGKLERLGHMGHIRIYSQQEVQNMLEFAGLSVLSVTPAGRLNLPPVAIRLLLQTISFAAMVHPKARFSAQREAFYSHLYVIATA